MNEFMLMSQTS